MWTSCPARVSWRTDDTDRTTTEHWFCCKEDQNCLGKYWFVGLLVFFFKDRRRNFTRLSHLFHPLQPSDLNSVTPACFIPLFMLFLSYSIPITPLLLKEGTESCVWSPSQTLQSWSIHHCTGRQTSSCAILVCSYLISHLSEH